MRAWEGRDRDLGRPIAAPLEQCADLLGVDLARVREVAVNVEPYVGADGTRVWSLMQLERQLRPRRSAGDGVATLTVDALRLPIHRVSYRKDFSLAHDPRPPLLLTWMALCRLRFAAEGVGSRRTSPWEGSGSMVGGPGRRPARTLIIVLMVVALVALLVGLFYFTIPADKIPSWLPGRDITMTAHHVRRATALVVVGALCVVAAWIVATRARTARR